MPQLDAEITNAILRVAIAGAIGGLIGGFFTSRRTNIFGSILMGVIGGITAATLFRITNVRPLIDAGQGFSYVYGFGGGILLGGVVAASER